LRPYLENTLHKKRAGGVAQSVGPEFKSQYLKIKRRFTDNKEPPASGMLGFEPTSV
jgi:hypothetical protein